MASSLSAVPLSLQASGKHGGEQRRPRARTGEEAGAGGARAAERTDKDKQKDRKGRDEPKQEDGRREGWADQARLFCEAGRRGAII